MSMKPISRRELPVLSLLVSQIGTKSHEAHRKILSYEIKFTFLAKMTMCRDAEQCEGVK